MKVHVEATIVALLLANYYLIRLKQPKWSTLHYKKRYFMIPQTLYLLAA